MMKTQNQAFVLAACFAMLGATGCAGARSHVIAPESQYPISMSDGVRDADGSLLLDKQKRVVGGFQGDYMAWGWLWSLVSFTGDHDISDEINEQVKQAGGDAIVNLAVRSEPCLWNVFTLIGVVPDCAYVRVRGHIIKKVAVVAPPPPTAPPPPAPTPTAPSESAVVPEATKP